MCENSNDDAVNSEAEYEQVDASINYSAHGITNANKTEEEPLYCTDDLKKKYKSQKFIKVMLQYDKLDTQQKEIVAKVQAIIVVVSDNEFVATMCYLAPPDHHNAVLKIQFITTVGFDNDPRIFHLGKFGKCPVAVTRVRQGCGKDVIYHATKEYFKNLVLIMAVGVTAGFPESDVKLGDVLISNHIHDYTINVHQKIQNDNYIAHGNVPSASKFMLDLLKDHFDWNYPCTKDEKRDASVKFGITLSKPVLLSDVADKGQLLQDYDQGAKGFEMEGFGITDSSIGFITIKGVCDFAGDKNQLWEPTAALAANDYLYHHFCQTDLSLLLEDLCTKKLAESTVLQHFYRNLQNGIPIDDLLPQLVTKKIITINDKMLISEISRDVNERCQYFLDRYISKPLSAGDCSAFYKLLQIMNASPQCIMLAAKIKQCLMSESMQDNLSELCLSDASSQEQLPQLDTLVAFYDKICKTLPLDEFLPKLVTQRIITIDEKTRIAASGKTESERTQHLLDHYIARPLSAGDPSFFHKLLDVMSGSPKCDFLINDIQCHLSTAVN